MLSDYSIKTLKRDGTKGPVGQIHLGLTREEAMEKLASFRKANPDLKCWLVGVKEHLEVVK